MKEKEKSFDKENIILNVEKMTKQSIEENQTYRNKLSKKRSLQEKGITLIALVVTIIILLILAGITLNIALSDGGLFSKTQEAAEKYKQVQSDEEEMVKKITTQMYIEYAGAEITGYKLEEGTSTCTVDNVTTDGSEQTFNRDEDMTWKIWDFDGNIVRIIGEPTTQKLKLQGANGYNNGLWALDYICRTLYSNNESGVSATTLKRTDIQKVSNYDYTKFKHNVGGQDEMPDGTKENTLQFGEVVTYGEETTHYPALWDKNDRKWAYEYNDDGNITVSGKECNIWEYIGTKNDEGNGECETNDETKFKLSNYRHVYKIDEFIDDNYYKMLYVDLEDTAVSGKYWIGTRSVDTHTSTNVGFRYSNRESRNQTIKS